MLLDGTEGVVSVMLLEQTIEFGPFDGSGLVEDGISVLLMDGGAVVLVSPSIEVV